MKAILIFLSLFLLFTLSAHADELTDKLKNNLAEQQKLMQAIQDAQTQERSLKQQMVYMDDQVRLTTLKIDETSTKMESLNFDIASLSAKILRLEDSLDNISQILISRISSTYKRGNLKPVELLLSARGFSDLLARLKYIKVVQTHDKKLMFEMEQTKTDYKEQKATLEVKKEEVELLQKQLQGYKNALSQQKKDKQKILEMTQNDEKKFQKLLEDSRKEQSSIQNAINAMSFSKETAKHVKKGDLIGLMGNTGYSSGAHLHFGVYNYKLGDNYVYDQNFLNPCDGFINCNKSNDTLGDGKYKNPMNNPIVSQWFGPQQYCPPVCYKNGIHVGIDMYNNDDILIHAAEEGDAFFIRGGQTAGNGVIIYHPDNKMTLYWHLQ